MFLYVCAFVLAFTLLYFPLLCAFETLIHSSDLVYVNSFIKQVFFSSLSSVQPHPHSWNRDSFLVQLKWGLYHSCPDKVVVSQEERQDKRTPPTELWVLREGCPSEERSSLSPPLTPEHWLRDFCLEGRNRPKNKSLIYSQGVDFICNKSKEIPA